MHLTFPLWLAALLLLGPARRGAPLRDVSAAAGGEAPAGAETDAPPPAADTETWIWGTWGRPLTECLEEHHARMGGRCRREVALSVRKSEHWLIVTCDGVPVKGYFAATGSRPGSAKERRGDNRTPEGEYFIWGRNGASRYYLSLGVSYPNVEDGERGLAAGLIDAATHQRIAAAERAGECPPQHTRLGGDIYIHGGGLRGEVVAGDDGKEVQVKDWTAGCIALRNEDVAELFAWIPDGTPLRIEP